MKTIEQKNRMIAEFIGKEIYQYHHESFYHSSWDWLMPVVEKIENYNSGSTLVIIEDERCHLDTQNNFEIDSVGHTKIEATYNAVVQFIEWYNENK